MTAAPVRCERCHRSVWYCPGGDDCATKPDDVHGGASCSPAAHHAMAIRRPATLRLLGVEDNETILSCPRCSKVIRIDVESAVAMSAPVRVVRRRRATPVTAVQPTATMQELNDEARARLRL